MTYYPWQFMVSLRSWWWPWGSWWFWWSRDDQNTTQGIRRRRVEEGREAGGCSEDDRQIEVNGSQQWSSPGIATVKHCVHNFSKRKTGNLNFRWTTLLLQAKNWTRKWCQSWATWRYFHWIQVATIWLFSQNNMTIVVLSLFLKFLESKSANFEFRSQPRIISVWQPMTKRKVYHIYRSRRWTRAQVRRLQASIENYKRPEAPSWRPFTWPGFLSSSSHMKRSLPHWYRTESLLSWMKTKCLLSFLLTWRWIPLSLKSRGTDFVTFLGDLGKEQKFEVNRLLVLTMLDHARHQHGDHAHPPGDLRRGGGEVRRRPHPVSCPALHTSSGGARDL